MRYFLSKNVELKGWGIQQWDVSSCRADLQRSRHENELLVTRWATVEGASSWGSAGDAFSRMSHCSLIGCECSQLDLNEVITLRALIKRHVKCTRSCVNQVLVFCRIFLSLFFFVSATCLLTWVISGKNWRRMPIVLLLLRAASLSASAITSRSRVWKKFSYWPCRTINAYPSGNWVIAWIHGVVNCVGRRY